MSIAVQTGIIHEQLAVRYPGNYHYARWLTLANRILRLCLYQNSYRKSKNSGLLYSECLCAQLVQDQERM